MIHRSIVIHSSQGTEMITTKWPTGRIVAFTLLALLAPAAERLHAQAKHPALHKALYDLRDARKELNDAPDVFGGHKGKAIDSIDAAIVSIEKALISQKDFNFKGIKDKNDKDTKKGDFPRIRNAIEGLQEARQELKNGNNNFGGFKEKAIDQIDDALIQLRAAMKAVSKK